MTITATEVQRPRRSAGRPDRRADLVPRADPAPARAARDRCADRHHRGVDLLLGAVGRLRHRRRHGQLPGRGGDPRDHGGGGVAADDRRRVRPVVGIDDGCHGDARDPPVQGGRGRRRSGAQPVHRRPAVVRLRHAHRLVQRHDRGEDPAPELHRDARDLLHLDRGQAQLRQAVRRPGRRRRPQRGRGLRLLVEDLRRQLGAERARVGGPRRGVDGARDRRGGVHRDRRARDELPAAG